MSQSRRFTILQSLSQIGHLPADAQCSTNILPPSLLPDCSLLHACLISCPFKSRLLPYACQKHLALAPLMPRATLQGKSTRHGFLPASSPVGSHASVRHGDSPDFPVSGNPSAPTFGPGTTFPTAREVGRTSTLQYAHALFCVWKCPRRDPPSVDLHHMAFPICAGPSHFVTRTHSFDRHHLSFPLFPCCLLTPDASMMVPRSTLSYRVYHPPFRALSKSYRTLEHGRFRDAEAVPPAM